MASPLQSPPAPECLAAPSPPRPGGDARPRHGEPHPGEPLPFESLPLATSSDESGGQTPQASGPSSLLEEGYRATDRFLVRLLFAHVGLALALAPLRGTWLLALLVGGGATVAAALSARLAPGRLVTRVVVAVALMAYSGLIVQQTGGMVEMHFHIFGALAFLLMYRDWRAPVAGAAAIAVHHVVAHELQRRGLPVFLFADHIGYHIVAVHAAWVVFETSVLVYMARQLATQARQAQDLMLLAVRLGEGDLTAQAHADDGVVGRAASAINAGTARLADSIGRLQAGAGRFGDLSRTTSQATRDAAAVAQQAEDATRQVAESARRQMEGTQTLSSVVDDLISAVDGMSATAAHAGTLSRDAAQVARRGADAVDAAIAGMRRVHETVRGSALLVQDMETHSQKIDDIVNVITTIASQTNLLALNAAIEAARAGEHGRGFAVVADEVRKLAEMSTKSVAEIAALVEQIRESIGRVVDGMSQGTAHTEEGVELAGGAGSALRDILQAVEQTTADVERIAAAAAQIAGRGEQGRSEAAGAVCEIVVSAESNRASADEVLAAMERLRAAVDQITACAAELDAVSRDVADRAEVFAV